MNATNEKPTTGVTDTDATPRIYVASLADYSAGRLHGCWIDVSQPVEDIRAGIASMLAQSSEPIAEEWAIHDYENFGGLHLSEFEDLEALAEVAGMMAEHGRVFAELVNYFGGPSNLGEARQHMEEAYRGAFDSVADYAAELVEECYSSELKAIPDFIRYHIDYAGIGDDLELSGDIFTIQCDGQVHVFDAHV